MTLHLHGIGHFHPEVEITNAFLEELDIGTNEEWIMERVGIRSRRTVLPLEYLKRTKNADPREAVEAALYTNAETGKRAAELAIARAGIDKKDIGMVLAGSCVVDTITPAEACNIAAALELEVPAFDTISACTSFHVPLYMLSLMDPARVPEFVLIVTPENVTRVIDYRDRAGAVLFGDASAAAVISTRTPGRALMLGNTMASSPAGHDKVFVPRMGHFRQEGRTVQSFAIKRTAQLVSDLRERFADPAREFHFIGHQANAGMLQNVCRVAEIDDAHHHSNVEQYGNTGAAGSASVISMRWDEWNEKDDIAVAGVGAGLTWSSYFLRFGAAP